MDAELYLLFAGAQHRQPEHSPVLRSAHHHVPLIDHMWLSYNGRQSSAILCCVHISVISSLVCLHVCVSGIVRPGGQAG